MGHLFYRWVNLGGRGGELQLGVYPPFPPLYKTLFGVDEVQFSRDLESDGGTYCIPQLPRTHQHHKNAVL